MSECKPCQLVECVPANDYTYSLALPPPPAQPPPPFGNDELSYCCPSGTISVSGTIPAWIEVNTVTNCVSVVPNTFRASDKAVANGTAQNALNQFVAAQVSCSVVPAEFHNVLATFYKTCTGGVYEGPAICETVDAGVFTSMVSQQDADTMARYAAYVDMIPDPPGPCCQGPAYLGAGGWANYSVPAQNTTDLGRSAIWTWNDTGAVLTFDLTMVPDPGRPDTNEAIEIVMRWDYCNAWPIYDFHLHLDYSWDATNIDGAGVGAGLQAIYNLGGSTALPVLDQLPGSAGSGSYDVTFPSQFGADFLQILIDLGNSTTTHVASGFFRGTMTLTPLIPPTYVAPTCSVMSAVPVPFDYALRPANDDFDDAIFLAGASGSLVFDNTYASMEPDEPLTISGTESDRTGWYAWIAPFSGTVTFDPAGSTMVNDPAIAVYTGTALLNLVSVIEKNQTAPPFTWAAVGGTLYYWRIGGYRDDKGECHLAWTLV